MEGSTFSAEIQGRISRFKSFLIRQGFSRPQARFVADVLFALLKCRHVHVMALSRALGEKVAPKKTWERLRRGLARVSLWHKLTEAILLRYAHEIRQMPYCVIDLSDVQKEYATLAEGLALVRDGSSGKENRIGLGWWWLNGVMSDGEQLLPVHGELFSVQKEGSQHQSENTKMVALAARIHQMNPDAIMVIDRGGDRETVMEPLLEQAIPFVIRGMSLRHLRLHADSSRRTNIEVIARRVRLTARHTLRRSGSHGRPETVVFEVGIKRVYLGEHPLWLVVARRHGGGLSWFLSNLAGTRRQIMSHTMKAYAERWRIEEYHRQIKQDFHLEQIAVRDYSSLKSMSVLVMLAASFLMRLPARLVHGVLSLTGMLPRKRLSEMPRYYFYMLSAAIARLLAAAIKRPPRAVWVRIRDYFQLSLDLRPAT